MSEEVHATLAPELEGLAARVRAAVEAHDALAAEDPEALPPAERTAGDLALVRSVLGVLRASPDQLEPLDARAGGMLEEWMTSLPFDLAEHARLDDALELATQLQKVCGGFFAGTETITAAILVRAGRLDEARARIEGALAASPDDPMVLEDAAELFADALAEPERARGLWLRLIELGRAPFVEHARARLAELPPPEPAAPFVAPAKPGRNDPCSCGSGKKSKKCCGA